LLQVPNPGGTTLFPVCQLAIAGKDLAELRGCVERLKSVAPREAPTYFFTWVVAMSDRDWDAAYGALEQARRLGLPEAQYASMKANTARARGPIPVILRASVVALTGWALGLAALLGLGLVLSWVAMRVAQRPPTVQTGEFLGLTGGLRSAYRAVLWVSCLYYYISIPIVLAVVVITGGGLIYAFFAMGHVPIKLVALIAIGVLVTIWAALKSLLVRTADEDPGDRLEKGKHPRLQQVLDEVAQQIGTRSVNNVYLTPGTEFAVTERGGLTKQLRGVSERCLILGVGVLDGMKVGPFKAVLAHEYGHFSNRDTAGGGFALTVLRSLLRMAYSLAQGGVAAWYNPAWLFLAGFNRVFLRISQGASRLQEIMADRWAAFAYGAEAFEQGLRHVVERSVRFQAHANSSLREVVDGKLALANLYAFRPSKGPVEGEIVEAVDKLIHAKPSPYDSHPSPVERLALVHSLPKRRSGAGPDAERDAWDLFEDPAVIQCWMTDRVRTNVEKNHGVTIPRAL
ncbi:MAG TPA: M48 family metallopeptidase, partial [Vicinamibacteria bacterium]|nr:M48 family metallopeptidase [Vicinamibacteria bacterium]